MEVDRDSVSLPEFEERLWEELARLHPQGQGAAGHVRPARARRPRRYLVAAVGLIVVAGLVAAVVSSGDADEAADVAAAPDATPDAAEPDAVSPDGAEPDAVSPDGADGRPAAIVFTEQVNADGAVSHQWDDEETGLVRFLLFDAAGNPVSDTAWIAFLEPAGTIRELTVDHLEGTYEEWDWQGPGGDGPWPPEPVRDEDVNRQRVAKGMSVEDGLETIDGRELLRLVDALGLQVCAHNSLGEEICVDENAVELDPEELICGDEWFFNPGSDLPVGRLDGSIEPDPRRCVPAGELELHGPQMDPSLGVNWVDPDTYQSVQRLGYPGSSAEYTHTYEFLERTPENLELLEAEIPNGYVDIG